MSEFPEKLKYNEDNSWVKVDGDTAIVGIVGPAAEKVQEFVFIQLPEKGKKIQKGDNYLSVEAIKWSGHLKSPVTGEITQVNDELFDEPGKINEDPYGSWIMKIKLDDPKEIDSLLDASKAKEVYKE
ncbi:MAG: glycine cleavage system protein H [Nanobdellota archaeon]